MARSRVALAAYVRGARVSTLGEPDDIVHDFFARNLGKSDYLPRWLASGLSLRRWLMNGISAHIRALWRPTHRAQVGLLLDELGASAPLREVPDPYGGDRDGFERVHTLVEQACGALLERLTRGH